MADIFDVIADGTRRDILHLLRERETFDGASDEQGVSVSQIVAEIGVSQPTVSKHLKVLREAQLVVAREQGQHRFYSLQAEPLTAVREWVRPFTDDTPVASASDADADDVERAPADVGGEAAAAAPTRLPQPAALLADAVGRVAAAAARAWERLSGR